MIINLSRKPIWSKIKGLDITIKSGKYLGKNFAPSWKMVLGHKTKEISDEEYTEKYNKILDNIDLEIFDELYNYGIDNNNEIIFLCYCADDKFCHTYLLIDYLIKKFPDKFKKKETDER